MPVLVVAKLVPPGIKGGGYQRGGGVLKDRAKKLQEQLYGTEEGKANVVSLKGDISGLEGDVSSAKQTISNCRRAEQSADKLIKANGAPAITNAKVELSRAADPFPAGPLKVLLAAASSAAGDEEAAKNALTQIRGEKRAQEAIVKSKLKEIVEKQVEIANAGGLQGALTLALIEAKDRKADVDSASKNSSSLKKLEKKLEDERAKLKQKKGSPLSEDKKEEIRANIAELEEKIESIEDTTSSGKPSAELSYADSQVKKASAAFDKVKDRYDKLMELAEREEEEEKIVEAETSDEYKSLQRRVNSAADAYLRAESGPAATRDKLFDELSSLQLKLSKSPKGTASLTADEVRTSRERDLKDETGKINQTAIRKAREEEKPIETAYSNAIGERVTNITSYTQKVTSATGPIPASEKVNFESKNKKSKDASANAFAKLSTANLQKEALLIGPTGFSSEDEKERAIQEAEETLQTKTEEKQRSLDFLNEIEDDFVKHYDRIHKLLDDRSKGNYCVTVEPDVYGPTGAYEWANTGPTGGTGAYRTVMRGGAIMPKDLERHISDIKASLGEIEIARDTDIKTIQEKIRSNDFMGAYESINSLLSHTGDMLYEAFRNGSGATGTSGDFGTSFEELYQAQTGPTGQYNELDALPEGLINEYRETMTKMLATPDIKNPSFSTRALESFNAGLSALKSRAENAPGINYIINSMDVSFYQHLAGLYKEVLIKIAYPSGVSGGTGTDFLLGAISEVTRTISLPRNEALAPAATGPTGTTVISIRVNGSRDDIVRALTYPDIIDSLTGPSQPLLDVIVALDLAIETGKTISESCKKRGGQTSTNITSELTESRGILARKYGDSLTSDLARMKRDKRYTDAIDIANAIVYLPVTITAGTVKSFISVGTKLAEYGGIAATAVSQTYDTVRGLNSPETQYGRLRLGMRGQSALLLQALMKINEVVEATGYTGGTGCTGATECTGTSEAIGNLTSIITDVGTGTADEDYSNFVNANIKAHNALVCAIAAAVPTIDAINKKDEADLTAEDNQLRAKTIETIVICETIKKTADNITKLKTAYRAAQDKKRNKDPEYETNHPKWSEKEKLEDAIIAFSKSPTATKVELVTAAKNVASPTGTTEFDALLGNIDDGGLLARAIGVAPSPAKEALQYLGNNTDDNYTAAITAIYPGRKTPDKLDTRIIEFIGCLKTAYGDKVTADLVRGRRSPVLRTTLDIATDIGKLLTKPQENVVRMSGLAAKELTDAIGKLVKAVSYKYDVEKDYNKLRAARLEYSRLLKDALEKISIVLTNSNDYTGGSGCSGATGCTETIASIPDIIGVLSVLGPTGDASYEDYFNIPSANMAAYNALVCAIGAAVPTLDAINKKPAADLTVMDNDLRAKTIETIVICEKFRSKTSNIQKLKNVYGKAQALKREKEPDFDTNYRKMLEIEALAQLIHNFAGEQFAKSTPRDIVFTAKELASPTGTREFDALIGAYNANTGTLEALETAIAVVPSPAKEALAYLKERTPANRNSAITALNTFIGPSAKVPPAPYNRINEFIACLKDAYGNNLDVDLATKRNTPTFLDRAIDYVTQAIAARGQTKAAAAQRAVAETKKAIYASALDSINIALQITAAAIHANANPRAQEAARNAATKARNDMSSNLNSASLVEAAAALQAAVDDLGISDEGREFIVNAIISIDSISDAEGQAAARDSARATLAAAHGKNVETALAKAKKGKLAKALKLVVKGLRALKLGPLIDSLTTLRTRLNQWGSTLPVHPAEFDVIEIAPVPAAGPPPGENAAAGVGLNPLAPPPGENDDDRAAAAGVGFAPRDGAAEEAGAAGNGEEAVAPPLQPVAPPLQPAGPRDAPPGEPAAGGAKKLIPIRIVKKTVIQILLAAADARLLQTYSANCETNLTALRTHLTTNVDKYKNAIHLHSKNELDQLYAENKLNVLKEFSNISPTGDGEFTVQKFNPDEHYEIEKSHVKTEVETFNKATKNLRIAKQIELKNIRDLANAKTDAQKRVLQSRLDISKQAVKKAEGHVKLATENVKVVKKAFIQADNPSNAVDLIKDGYKFALKIPTGDIYILLKENATQDEIDVLFSQRNPRTIVSIFGTRKEADDSVAELTNTDPSVLKKLFRVSGGLRQRTYRRSMLHKRITPRQLKLKPVLGLPYTPKRNRTYRKKKSVKRKTPRRSS